MYVQYTITAIYCDFTAISVLEIIVVFTAFYCIFQITEIYCDFSESHCDFHPSTLRVWTLFINQM